MRVDLPRGRLTSFGVPQPLRGRQAAAAVRFLFPEEHPLSVSAEAGDQQRRPTSFAGFLLHSELLSGDAALMPLSHMQSCADTVRGG